jgi:hypothetical protein
VHVESARQAFHSTQQLALKHAVHASSSALAGQSPLTAAPPPLCAPAPDSSSSSPSVQPSGIVNAAVKHT